MRSVSVARPDLGLIGKARVLIIDANQFFRSMTKDLVRQAGVKNSFAVESEEKVRKAFEPNIALIDRQVENSNAIALLRRIRSGKTLLPPDIPVIMTASQADAGFIAKARQAGIDSFLLRPASALSIRDRICHAMRPERKFIESRNYIGPCRRKALLPGYKGPWRRAADEADAEVPENEMQQLMAIFAEINTSLQNVDDNTDNKVGAIYDIVTQSMERMGSCGDGYVHRIFDLAREYIQSIKTGGKVDMKVLKQYFRLATDYVGADEASRKIMVKQIEGNLAKNPGIGADQVLAS